MKCNFKFTFVKDKKIYCSNKAIIGGVQLCDGDDCIFMKILKQLKVNDTKEKED